ncbi:hypothetical protein GQ600_23474 [Phytophthora cactorum]|nr:hypothetical protein GQ600_23474 [Phytophthora cactorum]
MSYILVVQSTLSGSDQRRTRPRRPTAPAAMASPSPPPKPAKSAKKRPVAATLTTKSKKPTKPKKAHKEADCGNGINGGKSLLLLVTYGEKKTSPVLAKLHNDLIGQSRDCFIQSRAAPDTATERPSTVQGEHKLTQTTDYRHNNGIQRLRPRQCKVCSFYKPEGRSWEERRPTTVRRAPKGRKVVSDLVQQGTWPSTE